VRRQTDLNVLSNRNAWTELARAHVQSIEVRPLGLSSAAQGQVTTLRTKDKAPPDHLRLVITADEAKTTTIDTVIYLR
jgi:hypothetical protein